MALYDIYQGRGAGNKLSVFTATANDSTAINTSLNSVHSFTALILGTNTVNIAITSISSGNVTVSLSSPTVATATSILSFTTVTVIYTVHCLAGGA